MAHSAAQAAKASARRTLPLRFANAPILKRQAVSLRLHKLESAQVQSFFENMEETMRYHGVASLSAPQCGESTRAFCMEIWEERSLVDRRDDELIKQFQDRNPESPEEMESAIEAVVRRVEEVEKRYKTWEAKGRLGEDLEVLNTADPDVRDLIQLNPCEPEIFINPTYEPLTEERFLYYETHASAPGMMIRRSRYKHIKANFTNRLGETRTTYMTAVDSREFQQMCDFLEGVAPQDEVTWEDILWWPEVERRDDLCLPKIREFFLTLPKSELPEFVAYGFDPHYPPPNDELLRMIETFRQDKAAGKIAAIEPSSSRTPLLPDVSFGDAVLTMATKGARQGPG